MSWITVNYLTWQYSGPRDGKSESIHSHKLHQFHIILSNIPKYEELIKFHFNFFFASFFSIFLSFRFYFFLYPIICINLFSFSLSSFYVQIMGEENVEFAFSWELCYVREGRKEGNGEKRKQNSKRKGKRSTRA